MPFLPARGDPARPAGRMLGHCPKVSVMQTEEAFLDLAALLTDHVALSESLLAGDLVEARFRARLIAGNACRPSLANVQLAASEVGRLLGLPGHRPLPGYARAVLDLSEELGQALSVLRP